MKHCTQCGEPSSAEARFCPRCGTPFVAAGNDAMLGKVVADRYLLVEKVGQGTSGTIYRGEHTTLKKRVAVKILHHQLSQDETAIERFRREATTVCEIENEHIPQVLDFGKTPDGRLFFAMEFLEGECLDKLLLREGALPPDRVIDILLQLSDALMEAHGLGYVHRDLRPRNVLLTTRRGRNDFVKLLDFGLAKLILPHTEAKKTALGMNFGDPRYMSPEQARGDSVDRRADIYSLGCIAFEMLSGQPPYVGNNPFETLQKHLESPVPHVRDKKPDCPPWLDQVVARALAKRPDERFITVLKMAECLRERRAPLAADAEEQAAHAKLTATAQIKAVKPSGAAPVTAAPVAAAAAAPQATASAGQTQALTTLSASSRPTVQLAPAADKSAPAAKPAADKPAPAAKPTAVNQALPQLKVPPRTATVSGEMRAAPSSEAAAEAVPSVLVEADSAPKAGVDDHPTLPIPKKQAPEPLPPPPEVPSARKDKDQTGEWFSDSGNYKQVDRAPGVLLEDDDEFAPPRNRAGWIIGGVAGGLTVVGAIVIALLPRSAKKPAPPADPPAVAAPAPAAAPPAPAPASAPVEPPAAAVAPAPAPTPAPPAPVEPPAPSKPAVAAKSESAPEAKDPTAAAKAAPATKPKSDAPAKEPVADKPAKTTVAAAEPLPQKSDKKGDKKPSGADWADPFASKPTRDPAQAEFYLKLGRQKLRTSDLSAAAANFNKAREFDPQSPEAFAGLGEVSFEQGDYSSALVHLKQALKLSPRHPRYLVLLGQSYYKLGKAREAADEYRKALKVDPNNREAQRSLDLAEKKLQGG